MTDYLLFEQLLQEAPVGARAPLFRFMGRRVFDEVLKSNKIKGTPEPFGDGTPKISFTRDPSRTFTPRSTGEGYGFRFDASKLKAKFGKKLRPFAKGTPTIDDLLSPKDRERVLDLKKKLAAGTATKKEITSAKSIAFSTSGARSTESIPSSATVTHFDLAAGITGQSAKFESETRLFVEEIPNVKSFIDGVMLPAPPQFRKIKKGDVTAAAVALMVLSGVGTQGRGGRGSVAFRVRKKFLDDVSELGVPIVFGRQEFSAQQVNREIARLFGLRKRNLKAFEEEIERVVPQKQQLYFKFTA